MPKIAIEYTTSDIRSLILKDLAEKMRGKTFSSSDLKIMVKTSQNYKAEWEQGQFKCEATICE